ncbi:MAG: HAMP domain-containing protein, partial [Anaerolineaceae bacterium]|nr:HAMP domain-containing protein [Anaerolineaceae bacterium]
MPHHLRLTHKLIFLVVLTAGVSVCVPSMLVIRHSTRTIERHVKDLATSEAHRGVLAVKQELRDNSRRLMALSEELARLGDDPTKWEIAVQQWFADNADALMVGTDGRAARPWHHVRQGGPVQAPIPLAEGVTGLQPYNQVGIGLEQQADKTVALIIADQKPRRLPLVAKWRMNRFNAILKQIRFHRTGHVFLVNRRGLLLAHPHLADGQGNPSPAAVAAGQDLSNLDLVRDAFVPDRKARLRYDSELGEVVVAASVVIPGLNWAVVAEEPEREAMAEVEGMKQQVLLWGSTTGLVAVLLGLAIVAQITRPLESLSEAAIRVGEGDLTHPVGVGAQDEIGQLALAFNEMQIRLREMYEKLERMVAERTHELQQTTDFLNSVLDSSTEYSIIATDLQGTILS